MRAIKSPTQTASESLIAQLRALIFALENRLVDDEEKDAPFPVAHGVDSEQPFDESAALSAALSSVDALRGTISAALARARVAVIRASSGDAAGAAREAEKAAAALEASADGDSLDAARAAFAALTRDILSAPSPRGADEAAGTGASGDDASGVNAANAALVAENARLLSSLFRSKTSISVVCRVRPLSGAEERASEALLASERSANAPEWWLAHPRPLPVVETLSDTEVAFWDKARRSWRGFAFDRVLGPHDSGAALARETLPLAAAALEGYKGCVLAYGVTGSGKTHSMEGTLEDRGVIASTVEHLFQLIARRDATHATTVTVSMLEIYNETLRDLLPAADSSASSAAAAAPSLDVTGAGVVAGLTARSARSASDLLALVSVGSALRATAATSIHARSSRSHCVVRIDVYTSARGGGGGGSGGDTQGRLYLVDLAGSERVAKSEAAGARLKEAQAINKSLAALGDALEALDKKSAHVPFRNSKLTHLLADSLGGSARTILLCTVGPAHATADETLFSLFFAARARRIDLGPATRAVAYKNIATALTAARTAAADANAAAHAAQAETLLLKEKFATVIAASVAAHEAVVARAERAEAAAASADGGRAFSSGTTLALGSVGHVANAVVAYEAAAAASASSRTAAPRTHDVVNASPVVSVATPPLDADVQAETAVSYDTPAAQAGNATTASRSIAGSVGANSSRAVTQQQLSQRARREAVAKAREEATARIAARVIEAAAAARSGGVVPTPAAVRTPSTTSSAPTTLSAPSATVVPTPTPLRPVAASGALSAAYQSPPIGGVRAVVGGGSSVWRTVVRGEAAAAAAEAAAMEGGDCFDAILNPSEL